MGISATPINVGPYFYRTEHTEEFILSSVVRGYCVHQTIWEVAVSEELPCKAEDKNCFDHFETAVQWVEQTYSGLKFGDFMKTTNLPIFITSQCFSLYGTCSYTT